MSAMHPVQVRPKPGQRHQVTSAVTLRAYEVYSHLYSPQPAMVEGGLNGCRGGFGAGELMAFLYARSFPKTEWQARFDEALKGMVI